ASQCCKRPLPFLKAISFPTALLIIFKCFTNKTENPWKQEMYDINCRILFSTCHFGSIATLLILLNHFHALR
ncbi:hypothetical protein PENTCL1PPCAC_6107, partial [Pristionchus entomophagus]